MATKRKMRKFAEGDYVSTEGANPNIDDDTRSRALKFVENASEESRDIGAPVTRSASKSSSKISQTVAPAKKSTWEDDSKIPDIGRAPETPEQNKARMEGLLKKQAIEEVHPEDYVPGGGMLKAGLKAIVGAGARREAKDGLKTITREALTGPKSSGAVPALERPTPRLSGPSGAAAEVPRLPAPKAEVKTAAQERAAKGQATKAANKVRRSEEGFSPEEALKARKKAGYKSGGTVRSASSRADGCAIRGKTRA